MSILSDKIAIVTGASRGIGRAIAITLAEMGATVIGTATTSQGADHISTYLTSLHLQGCGMVLNVTDGEAIQQMLKTVTETYSAPTILVNNAGITQDNLMLRMKDEEWDAVIATDLTSAYRMSKACLRGMIKERWGRIITIGSVVGTSGNPGQANYCAAKAGVIGLSKSLAQEVASRNITVNVVAPGFIATDMTRALNDVQREAILKSIPSGQSGIPEDIAHAVAFLASPKAGYITGQTLHVNGGMHMN